MSCESSHNQETMITLVNFLVFLTQIQIRFHNEKFSNMIGSALMFIIVFNCMLCAKCDSYAFEGITANYLNDNDVEHSTMSGGIIVHKQLEQKQNWNIFNFDNTVVEDLEVLQSIMQHTGKDVYDLIFYFQTQV